MSNNATLIAALAIAAVVFFAIWDDTPSSRIQSGACDTGGRDHARVVTLSSGTQTVTDGNIESLQRPEGEFFVVPADHVLFICHILSAVNVTQPAVNRNLVIGYSVNTVMDSATQPATSTVIAAATLHEADQLLELNNTIFERVPEGNTPWMRLETGQSWAATVNGVLIPVDD